MKSGLEVKLTDWFKDDLSLFIEQERQTKQRFDLNIEDINPIIHQKTTSINFDRHYVYHTAWAARILAKLNPALHLDISSYTYFSTIISAFIPTVFMDYRPPKIELDNLDCGKADLTNLSFPDNQIQSLSCMHVVEHIGLGRYGDPIDYDGDLKAFEELQRVLAVNGNLLFVVPVGRAKIIFNAHRIYSYKQVLEHFHNLRLVEFALIPDNSNSSLIINPPAELTDSQDYGCGCFWFTKEKSMTSPLETTSGKNISSTPYPTINKLKSDLFSNNNAVGLINVISCDRIINNERAAFEMCRDRYGLGILIVWPTATKVQLDSKIRDSLSKFSKLHYTKKLQLNINGAINLLRHIHHGKEWWEKNLVSEVNKRFAGDVRVHEIEVILFEPQDINTIRRWKKAFRPTLRQEKSSFHVTDPDCFEHLGVPCECLLTASSLYQETIRHAQLLFNSNTVHFLNHSRFVAFPNFSKYMQSYGEWVTSSGIEQGNFCLDNGAVLAAYGIRDVHDIDFLFLGDFVETGLEGVDCHNRHFEDIRKQCDFGYTKDEIINNPEYHFYFHGYKMASFSITSEMKRKRLIQGKRRKKDATDAYLMEKHINNISGGNNLMVLIPEGGLGNRLRTIAIYKSIADYLGRKFYVYWPPSSREYNIKFEDLFENDFIMSETELQVLSRQADIRLIEIDYGVSDESMFDGRGGTDSSYYKDIHKINSLNSINEKNIIVKTCVKFYPDFIEEEVFDDLVSINLSALKPVQRIKDVVDLFVAKHFRGTVIGLHARRSDRPECASYSPDEVFMTKIRECLNDNAHCKFFLATDSPETEKIIKSQFGEVILTIQKKYDQANWERPSTIQEALIEMLLLSKTSKIYGSIKSSFGYIAAKMTNIPFQELKVDNNPFEFVIKSGTLSNQNLEKLKEYAGEPVLMEKPSTDDIIRIYDPAISEIAPKINSEMLTTLDFVANTEPQTEHVETIDTAAEPAAQSPSAVEKRAIIKMIARQFNTKVFVETGTYLGDTVATLINDFDLIYSIELDDKLYEQAQQRFAQYHHVQILHGDSGVILPQILANLNAPALFWLDGHYSKGITARGDLNTPIREELESVLNHHINQHIILIDDARLFVGKNDYPTISEVRSYITAERPSWRFELENDIIRIYNPQRSSADSVLTSSGTLKISDPLALLTAYRFDIPAKYIYAKYRKKGIDSNWHVDLYQEHLAVWNNFNENGQYTGQLKRSFTKFQHDFDTLIDAITTDGFDPSISRLWVEPNGNLINGGHRLAAVILANSPVQCELQPPEKGQYYCTWQYFRGKTDFVPTGLSSDAGDAMALQYVRLKANTYIVTVFPRAIGHDEEIRATLSKAGTIVYEKKVNFLQNGLFNFVKVLYEDEPWIGNHSNAFVGVQDKTNLCSAPGGALRLYLIESDDPSLVAQAKEDIRSIFSIDKHSVHINDAHVETVRIAEAAFNRNSLHFLENSKPGQMACFDALFDKYRKRLKCEDAEDFCIDGNAVLAAYGIKDTQELEFFCHHKKVNFWISGIGCHDSNVQRYTIANDEVIYNPACHFYHRGCKFASLMLVTGN